ncbi:MAG: GNAT family N-acetyltransferase [Granulosicoccus sp.]
MTMPDGLTISYADWQCSDDCKAVVDLLDAYALDPMGGGEGLPESVKKRLPETLAGTPGAFSLLAWHAGASGQKQPVAVANCFTSLSTFACLPLINIHDLAVLAPFRGRGVGQAMLAAVEKHARDAGCCKVTLEVLTGNKRARRAYEGFGFKTYSLDEATGYALLMQKLIDH